jgi:hemerythrin superfamily protein
MTLQRCAPFHGTPFDFSFTQRRHEMPPQDAISLLKEDHKKVKDLLSQLEKTTERGAKTREKLIGQIDMELSAHAEIEEQIFYPAFRDAVKKKEDREMYFEAVEEHHVVKTVLPEIRNTDATSEVFGAKAKVLKELVEHHAGEEEKEMFPAARKVLDKQELVALGEQMSARKKQILAKGVPKR